MRHPYYYIKKKRTGKYRVHRTLFGRKLYIQFKCDLYYKDCFVKKTKHWFVATSKDIRKLGL